MNNAATFEDAVTQIARELSLPRRFLPDLRLQDDWSFVVKSHALAESALTHLLATRLGSPDTSRAVACIGMSRKLSIVRSLNALPSKLTSGLQLLSEIRNGVVHDVRGVSFTFASYLAEGSHAVRFGKVCGRDDLPEAHPDAVAAANIARAHSKDSIWLLVLDVLAHVSLDRASAALDQLRRITGAGGSYADTGGGDGEGNPRLTPRHAGETDSARSTTDND